MKTNGVCMMNPLQNAVQIPQHGVPMHRALRWKILRQRLPLAARPQHVKKSHSEPRGRSPGALPPAHIPAFFEDANLSRMRSPVASRSNWANDIRTLRVSLPIEVVVLKDWVTDTNVTDVQSNTSTSLAKSMSERLSRSIC
jgi:hypothetical protein